MTRLCRGSVARRISGAQGMSVVEVIVAFSVIAVVALASATFYNQQRTLLTNFTPNGECKAVLEGQMGYFRQQGMAATGLPWKHDPGSVAGGVSHATAEPSRYDDAWLTSNQRFLPLQNIALVEATGTNQALVRNYPLQRGAMGILNALYNYQPGICNAAGVDPSALGVSDTLTPKVDPLSMKGFRSSMQIQQFDLTTKGNYACLTGGAQAWIRPKGFQEHINPKPYIFPPDVHSNRGYRVTLNGTYTDRTNAVKSCSLTEEFNFPVDNEAQSVSVIWSTTMPGSVGGSISPPEAMGMSRPMCSHTPGKPAGFTLKIGFDTTTNKPVETGTVFMCRDMSEQLNPNYCEEGPNHPQAGVGAVMQGNNYSSTDPRFNKWVPCSQVTACGIAPTQFKAHEINPSIPGSTIYELTYENSTAESRDGFWGCDIRMDVASVDLAGNFKMLSTQPPQQAGIDNIDARRFFQPADCYKCFKKKKRSWGSFIVSTIAFGPILSCLAGVGGVCRSSKGLKYVRHSCTNSAAGANVCIKQPVKRPKWAPDTNPSCDAMGVPLPTTYAGTVDNILNIPKSPSGTMIDEPQFYDSQSALCDVQAICDNGRWIGIPDEDGGNAPFVECGKVWTRYKIDISGVAPGQPAPAGAPECLITIPDSASVSIFDYNALYSGVKVCAPSTTGEPGNTLCSTTVNGSGGIDVHYPTHAMTGDNPNKDPNQYYYMKRIIPKPQNLPSCPE